MPTIWTEQDDIDFALAMNRLAAVFNRPVDAKLLHIYREELDQLDGDQAVSALGTCLSLCEFFPVPAVVLKHSGATCVPVMQQRIESRAGRRDKLQSQGVKMSAFMDRRTERLAAATYDARKMLADGSQ